ncbi:MAG TPA: hypothetical protein VK989_06715, partial [Polyangia bacterium]|nr:hypothetical protein [Polyangia bacterium]
LDAVLGGDWPVYDIGRFEFSAAHLVRMLALEHPRDLECLLGHLAGTEGFPSALAACFPERSAWSAEYGREQFRQDAIVGHLQLPTASVDNVTVRPMSNAEVHAALARLDDVVAGTMSMSDPRGAELREAANAQRERARALGSSAPASAR